MRELEHLLGRKTLENEILREDRAKRKNDLAAALAVKGRYPMKAIAPVLGVVRVNLAERLTGAASPRGPHFKAEDDTPHRRLAAVAAGPGRQPPGGEGGDLPVAGRRGRHGVATSPVRIGSGRRNCRR